MGDPGLGRLSTVRGEVPGGTPQLTASDPTDAGEVLREDGDEEPGFRVALICMPFVRAVMPSIQIGLLTSLARAAGFPTDGFYFNLTLCGQLGAERYEWMSEHRGEMTSEWLFTVAAFGDQRPSNSDDYLLDYPGQRRWVDAQGLEIDGDAALRDLSELRDHILPAFIDRCAASVDWSKYRVVGFTLTVHQATASLALATRIKQLSPETIIVVGGSDTEGSMGPEFLRAFPVIDYVVVGEGDIVFPQMLKALAEGRAVDVQGVLGRKAGEASSGQAMPVNNLDALPVPDYHDYYEQARRAGVRPLPRLPIEGSRGCWWGQKHHCTFCGLNGEGMGYRHKSPSRFLHEVAELSKAYGIRIFDAVDNILFPQYVNGVFDVIADKRLDYEFFFEVKSSIGRRDQMRRLSSGGLREIQPGIESLSTHVLELMDKGTTMLDNVRLLKWARYYGIKVGWNVLTGFPGETLKDYEAQLEVFRQIPHLHPPQGIRVIWLERFSPFFMDRERYPVRNLRVRGSYRYVYPETVRVDELAYFFNHEMGDTVDFEELHETEALIQDWLARWADETPPDSLTFTRTHEMMTITDHRRRERPLIYDVHGPMACIYESCVETHQSIGQVMATLNSQFSGSVFTETEVFRALEKYREAGLMIGEGDRYLSLALPANPNW